MPDSDPTNQIVLSVTLTNIVHDTDCPRIYVLQSY